jgi:hypothetical protein
VEGTNFGGGCYVATANFSVYRCGSFQGHGLLVEGPCLFVAAGSGAATTSAAVLGTGNSGAGIKCMFGGIARVNSNATEEKTAITGGLGALMVTVGAAVAYGTGVGEFEEVAGYNGNFTRMLEGTATAPTADTSLITTRSTFP